MRMRIVLLGLIWLFGVKQEVVSWRLEKIVLKPDPSLPIEEQSPLVLLPLTVWGEARGEPLLTKVCVAHVIINRSNKRGEGFREVVLKPKQFSIYNEGDVNRPKLLRAVELEGEGVWRDCVNASWMALVSREYDPTGGATHYFSGKHRPSWAKRMKETLVIRNVHFLRPRRSG